MPAEKRRGRPKTTETVTVLARLDKAFAEEVQDYAEWHRVPVSMLIRDGLRWRLGGFTSDHPSHEASPTPQGTETLAVAMQLRQLATLLERHAPALVVSQAQELHDVIHVIQDGTLETSIDGSNTVVQEERDASLVTDDLADVTEPDLVHVTDPVPEAVTCPEAVTVTAPVTDYDVTKYVLGKLCHGPHEFGSTGKTLLTLRGRKCPQCQTAQQRERRVAARRAGQALA